MKTGVVGLGVVGKAPIPPKRYHTPRYGRTERKMV